jgi:hypothetical protein
MGIMSQFPPGLITLLTWTVLWIAASLLILIISIGLGRLLSEFLGGILGWIK